MRAKPSRRRSSRSGPARAFGQRRIGPRDVHEMLVVERLRELEHDPVAIRGVVQVRRAPALQVIDLGGDRRLGGLVAGGPRGVVAVEQRAAGARHQQLTGAGLGRPGHEAVDVGVILGAGGHGGAALEQRQGPPAHEVDLEAEEVVVGARGLGEHLGVGADGEELRDEPADVRGHPHQQRRAVNRTRRRGGLGLPPVPQGGLGRHHVGDESGVEVGKTRRLMQVREGELGKSQSVDSSRRAHSEVAPRQADQPRYIRAKTGVKQAFKPGAAFDRGDAIPDTGVEFHWRFRAREVPRRAPGGRGHRWIALDPPVFCKDELAERILLPRLTRRLPLSCPAPSTHHH